MPSQAPTYYQWAQDKPCTTNQVYGYLLKVPAGNTTGVPCKGKPAGPFDYARPFSNSGFFPQISDQSALTTGKATGGKAVRYTARDYCANNNKNRFDINRGYVMGYVPVCEKVGGGPHSAGSVGSRRSRASSSASSSMSAQGSRGKNLYLWHTLSGSLVHVKNYPSQNPQDVSA